MRIVVAALPLLLLACSARKDASDSASTTDTDDAAGPYAGLPKPAPPEAYSGGTCPKIHAGNMTGFMSDDASRTFVVNLPKKPHGAGLLILWHGNGDTGTNYSAAMGAADIATNYHLIVFTPEKGRGGIGTDWGSPPSDATADTTFFNDMIACADKQYAIDLHRVYTSGFSAGALFSSYLVMAQANHLAGAVIFSGGADGGTGSGAGGVNSYSTPSWNIPVLMTEGGVNDDVIVSFHDMTHNMATKLRADGSTVIVCSHTLGHRPMPGFDQWAWPFLDAQVYGEKTSPYDDGKDPSGLLPDTCAWN